MLEAALQLSVFLWQLTTDCANGGVDGGIGDPSASNVIILEWAQKLLEADLKTVDRLAEHLVLNGFVNKRSPEAFTVLAASQADDISRVRGSLEL